MNDKTVTLVRQAIFTVLDEREWNFENDEQRVDFADRVASFIPSETPSLAAAEMAAELRAMEKYRYAVKLIDSRLGQGWTASLVAALEDK